MPGTIIHSPEDILRQLMISDGKGTHPDNVQSWPIFVDGEPDLPDNCITIRETVGRQLGYTAPDQEMQEYYGVQIRIRGKDYETCRSRFELLRIAIDKYTRETVTIDSTTYTLTAVRASTMRMGREIGTSRRQLRTINALLDILQTS